MSDGHPMRFCRLLRARRKRPCESQRTEPRDDLSPPHEHLPRKRTLLSTAVKHERVCYAIGRALAPRLATHASSSEIGLAHETSVRTWLSLLQPIIVDKPEL